MQEDQYLRRADGSIYGTKAEFNMTDQLQEAFDNLATLPYPVYDGSGCRYMPLGPAYGLIDYDAGKYRLGLYWNLIEEDEGGICAEFERFSDLKEFAMRLAAIHAPITRTEDTPDWENDGDPCNHCGQPAAYDPEGGWYYHIDPDAPACFLMGSERQEGENSVRHITESEGPYADTQEAHDRFLAALKEFYSAGMKLVAAWDDPDVEFHADEIWPLPAELRPPMSLDEWLPAMLAHYEEVQ